MKKKPDVRILALAAGAMVIAAAFFTALVLMLPSESKTRSDAERVTVAVPYSEWVQDHATNYYTKWLEEKSGYEIDFIFLEEGYERESLNAMLTSRHSGADAVLLPAGQDILSYEDYRKYIREGCLCAPEEYLGADANLISSAERFEEIDFENLLGEDGRMYCFPSARSSRTARKTQILWINIDWLKRLGLTVPRTAEEFAAVLEAFREGDPNGNGLRDEIPLVSCEAENSLKSYLYLINAFSYFDAEHLSRYFENGEAMLGTERAEFREGVRYCADLYGRGLLAGDCFGYTKKQLAELINDPADTVGAFSSQSIADIIYTNNPGVLAHFVQLAPLSSEYLEKGCAVSTDVIPAIGGLIPGNSAHKKAAAEILDLMLSEEAALIALYGEENVDWRFSRDGELSTYGTRASITTIRYLKNDRQNKNFAGAGPILAPAEYYDGVTWNGDHSMTEYIDARAAKTYEEYYRAVSDSDRALLREAFDSMGGEVAADAGGLLNTELARFITGERDVNDDADWNDFLDKFKEKFV